MMGLIWQTRTRNTLTVLRSDDERHKCRLATFCAWERRTSTQDGVVGLGGSGDLAHFVIAARGKATGNAGAGKARRPRPLIGMSGRVRTDRQFADGITRQRHNVPSGATLTGCADRPGAIHIEPIVCGQITDTDYCE